MLYKTNYVEITYEARFATPLFVIAGNPVAVLDAVYSRISPKYPVSPRDMSVDAARTVADVRARISLFSTRASLEFSSETFVARFVDPRGANDETIIKDCIQLTHDGLATLRPNNPVRYSEETVTVRMFNEVMTGNAHDFLRGLYPDSGLYPFKEAGPKKNVVPGYHMEFLNDGERWEFSLGLQRAVRSDKELFVVAIVRFIDGGRYSSIHEKGKHLVDTIEQSLARLGLQPNPQ